MVNRNATKAIQCSKALATAVHLRHQTSSFLCLCSRRDQVVGRNCRFLQGPGTDQAEVARMRAAIKGADPQPITVTLLNYR